MQFPQVPQSIKANLVALFAALGIGTGGSVYIAEVQNDKAIQQQVQVIQQDRYLQAVVEDQGTSLAIKTAMILGWYYESSNEVITKPYVDKLGKGQPLTVCNGITGKGVIANKIYTPKECYELEKGRYLGAEADASKLFRFWSSYTPLTQAIFLDFIHNKGSGALRTSTLLRMANAGNLLGACKQNERWNKGTVNGVSVVLKGLDIRAKANSAICQKESQHG